MSELTKDEFWCREIARSLREQVRGDIADTDGVRISLTGDQYLMLLRMLERGKLEE